MMMKVKFNAMDALIVLVIVAIIAFGGWFLTRNSQQKAVTENTRVQMMIEIARQDEDFTKLPQIGDEVVLGEKEKLHAEVTGIEINPAKTLGYDVVTGRALESEQPGKYDVHITVVGNGTETPDAIKIGETPLRVGSGMAVKSKNWAGYGFMLELDAVGQEVQ